MAETAFRELLQERKARSVKDTSLALLPTETLVREWTNIPTDKRDECKSYLLTNTSVINGDTAQNWVLDPWADGDVYTGRYRNVSVEVVKLPNKGFSIRQTLAKFYYTDALPSAVRVSSTDTARTPFDDNSVNDLEVVWEYPNISPDDVSALKPSIGDTVEGGVAIEVRDQRQDDGSFSIFVKTGSVSGTGTTVKTGAGVSGSVMWPDCPARTERHIFRDIDPTAVDAAIVALTTPPSGYIVREIERYEPDRDGKVDLIQVLEKLDSDPTNTTPRWVEVTYPGISEEAREYQYDNVSYAQLATLMTWLKTNTPVTGYKVQKVTTNYRGECRVDVRVMLDKANTSQTASDGYIDGIKTPLTEPEYTRVIPNVELTEAQTLRDTLAAEARTLSVHLRRKGRVADVVWVYTTTGIDYTTFKRYYVYEEYALSEYVNGPGIDRYKTKTHYYRYRYTEKMAIETKYHESVDTANTYADGCSLTNVREKADVKRLPDGSAITIYIYQVSRETIEFTLRYTQLHGGDGS